MFLLFLFLASCGAGTSTSTKFAKLCHDFNLPVTITTTNYVWGRPIFKNNYDVVDFIQDFNRRDFLETFSPVSGTINETATYIIGGTYCEPRVGKSATVLVATHGAGLDRRSESRAAHRRCADSIATGTRLSKATNIASPTSPSSEDIP